MTHQNMIIFMADEHSRSALGCYGHKLIQTPHLDKLAAMGTRFTNAYTPSPVCVPARAGFATGRYVYQTGCWTNSQPFRGQMPGWGQQLIDGGHDVVSIGKLHYRSEDDDNGFSEEIIPLHIRDGIGWTQGLIRTEQAQFEGTDHFAVDIGPGEDPYTDYDRRVCEKTLQWLQTEGCKKRDKPWILFVSFLRPHYPLTCPKENYDLYPLDQISAPRFAGFDKEFANPVVKAARNYYNYDDFFDDHSRLVARASYYGLCTFVDDLVGKIMGCLEDIGQDQHTGVIYTSDHGEQLGDHGLWTKCVMYEESVGIPLIVSGAGASRGVCNTPVSLIDIHQTVLQAAQLKPEPVDVSLFGRSLYDVAREPDQDRTILSEFHDGGSITGMFMIRHKNWKYMYYPGYTPQLFDLGKDPFEANDLGTCDNHLKIRTECHGELLKFCDPDAVNIQAFRDQAECIKMLGGVRKIMAAKAFDFTPVE